MKRFLFFKKKACQNKAFSLIELLTTVSIIGVLSVIGIRSYQTQTNKAKTAEARHSLSYIYSAEQNFKASWDTYHENLIAIGATPSGTYSYDIGFSKGVSLSKTDGYLANYPGQEDLDKSDCSNFADICKTGAGSCATALKTDSGTFIHFYFSGPGTYNAATNKLSCSVTATERIADETGFEADSNSFTAGAVRVLKTKDVWSIDESRNIEHGTDGTQ